MTKILFIMFEGSDANLKYWNENTESKFLDRLKELGSVYTYQDKTYNINHYDKSLPDHADYDSDIDIDLSSIKEDENENTNDTNLQLFSKKVQLVSELG